MVGQHMLRVLILLRYLLVSLKYRPYVSVVEVEAVEVEIAVIAAKMEAVEAVEDCHMEQLPSHHLKI